MFDFSSLLSRSCILAISWLVTSHQVKTKISLLFCLF